jgi:hypothetical protein
MPIPDAAMKVIKSAGNSRNAALKVGDILKNTNRPINTINANAKSINPTSVEVRGSRILGK